MLKETASTELQDGLLHGGSNRGLLTPANPPSGGPPSEADFKFKMHLPVTQKLKEGNRYHLRDSGLGLIF